MPIPQKFYHQRLYLIYLQSAVVRVIEALPRCQLEGRAFKTAFQPLVETGGTPVAIILSVGKAIAIAFPPITQLIKVVRSLKSDNPEKEEKHQRHQNQD